MPELPCGRLCHAGTPRPPAWSGSPTGQGKASLALSVCAQDRAQQDRSQLHLHFNSLPKSVILHTPWWPVWSHPALSCPQQVPLHGPGGPEGGAVLPLAQPEGPWHSPQVSPPVARSPHAYRPSTKRDADNPVSVNTGKNEEREHSPPSASLHPRGAGSGSHMEIVAATEASPMAHSTFPIKVDQGELH